MEDGETGDADVGRVMQPSSLHHARHQVDGEDDGDEKGTWRCQVGPVMAAGQQVMYRVLLLMLVL